MTMTNLLDVLITISWAEWKDRSGDFTCTVPDTLISFSVKPQIQQEIKVIKLLSAFHNEQWQLNNILETSFLANVDNILFVCLYLVNNMYISFCLFFCFM